MESDSFFAVSDIDKKFPFAIGGTLVAKIVYLFSVMLSISCCFVPRDGNKVACALVKYAISFSQDMVCVDISLTLFILLY